MLTLLRRECSGTSVERRRSYKFHGSQPIMRVHRIPVWSEAVTFLILYAIALICYWPMAAISGWSMRLAFQLGVLLLLVVLVTGQFVRHRHRLTLKGMLLLVSLAAILCALFGHRLVVANRQQAIADIVMSAGGRVGYDTDTAGEQHS
jgi:peptidoglycan/LPS O-acetylase OafA/YrhL